MAGPMINKAFAAGENVYDNIKVTDTYGSTDMYFFRGPSDQIEYNAKVSLLVVNCDNGNSLDIYMRAQRTSIDALIVDCGSGNKFYLDLRQSTLGLLDCTGSVHDIDGIDVTIDCIVCDDTDTGTANLVALAHNVKVNHVSSDVTLTNVSPDNGNLIEAQLLRDFDEDRNLMIVSEANFTWAPSTGVLTWDADIKINIPYSTYYNTIQSSESPETLANDGDAVVVTLDRTQSANITTSVVAKASMGAKRNGDTLVLAFRSGDSAYLWDGTRVDIGDVVRIGDHYSTLQKRIDALRNSVEVSHPKSIDLQGVASADHVTFAVGQADGTDAYMIKSFDGTKWTEVNPGGGDYSLTDIHWNGTYWVAVGIVAPTNPLILYATGAGSSWTLRSNSATDSLTAVTYNSGLSLWCAVGAGTGTDSLIMTSTLPSGSWTIQTGVGKDYNLRDVTVGASNRFIAVGDNDGTDPMIIVSDNGTSWSEKAVTAGKAIDLTGVAYDAENQILVAVGDNDSTLGIPYIVLSTDNGDTWTQVTNVEHPLNEDGSLGTGLHAESVAYKDGLWIVGASEGHICYSLDAITWNVVVTPWTWQSFSFGSITFNAVNRVIAVGDGPILAVTDGYI
jgi:hypothetical protein